MAHGTGCGQQGTVHSFNCVAFPDVGCSSTAGGASSGLRLVSCDSWSAGLVTRGTCGLAACGGVRPRYGWRCMMCARAARDHGSMGQACGLPAACRSCCVSVSAPPVCLPGLFACLVACTLQQQRGARWVSGSAFRRRADYAACASARRPRQRGGRGGGCWCPSFLKSHP
jgi:hypothetical protein